ncbi:MAG: XRE family transcriptional regulator [Spirochaetaceae bacterium]|nr:MAG: XRE family transcriptional regulator [Spirochaetaceae bacterium]
MSDLDRYIETRTEREPDFASVVEQEYENLRIGELIRNLREEHHLSQEQLARRLNTTKSAISRLENHADSIRLSTLERVAKAFDRKMKISIER